MTRKRIALLYVGLVATLVIATFVVLRETGAYRSFVENLLAKVIRAERFRLGDADVDIGLGRVILDRFLISGEGAAADRPLVAVERVELDVDTNALGSFGRIRQVTLKQLRLDLDLSEGSAPDLASILLLGDGESDADAGGDQPPPAILIEDSQVTLRFSPDAAPIEFSQVALQLLPEEVGGARMVLTGSMTSPAGLPTRVHGSADFAKREFRAMLEVNAFDLAPHLVERFSPATAELLTLAELDGRAESLQLWIEYDGARTTEPLVAGVQVDIPRLSGIPPSIEYPLVDATARLRGSTRGNGTVRVEVEDRDGRGDVSVIATLTECFTDSPQFEVAVEAKDVLIGPELKRAVSANPILERVWTAFDFQSGRADASVRVRNDDDGHGTDEDIDLTLRGLAIRWHGLPQGDSIRRVDFPELLTNVTGRIHLRDDLLTIDGVEFGLCEGIAKLEASIPTLPGRGGPALLELECDDIEFSDRLRASIAAVAPEAVEHYDQYAPQGRTAGRISIVGERGEDPELRIAIRPLHASASWAGFPYRVEQITGLVEIEPAGVAFDLDGERGAATVSIHGRFHHSRTIAERPDAAPDSGEYALSSQFWMAASGLRVDSDLETALATLGPELQQTVAFIAPGGVADCEMSLWSAPGDDSPTYDLRIDARDVDIQLESIPLPIRAIKGPIFIHGKGARSEVDVAVVRGIIDNEPGSEPAEVTVQGTIRTGPEGPVFDIVSTVENLELCDEVRDALDHDDAFDGTTWDVLQPSGFVNVIARQTRPPGVDHIRHELDIDLRGVTSSASILPAPATDIFGMVSVREEVASFRGLRGRMSGAEIFCSSGSASHGDGGTRFRVTVSCEDFPVDDNLANLFTGPLRETYLRRDLRGRLNVNQLDLDFRFPDAEQGDFELDLSGRFNVREGQLTVGVTVEDVVGLWRLESGRIGPDGGVLRGTVESGGFTMLGHRFNGAQFRFNASPELLELSNLRGRAHNGEVYGRGDTSERGTDVLYEFAGEGRLEADLGWRDVSLSSVLRASGLESNEVRGNLSGSVRLDNLHGSDIVNARGAANIEVSEGRLGVVPAFTAIYSHLSPNKRPQFDGVSLDISFGDQRVEVPRIEARSPLLSVAGSGSVTMDGYVDMTISLDDMFGTDADWLVLPSIVRMLTTEVVKFHVYGYLRAPQARPQWMWESSPDRVPLGPIPARERTIGLDPRRGHR